MNVIQAIEARKSVRTYTGANLTEEQSSIIRKAIADATEPFGGQVSIKLTEIDLKAPYKPGTYGVISGATNYLLMGIADNRESQLGAGFLMEQVVLKATEIGLGTCWIAATFKNSDFEKLANFGPDRPLRIVIPIGEPAEKQKFLEKATRLLVKSDKRKPFDELFFENDFQHPLSAQNRFAQPLQMMRLAPSSTNSQPWRAVVEGNKVHFYYADKSKCSILDCGIGLSHFVLTEHFNNQRGTFVHTNHPQSSQYHYLTTYTQEE